MNRATPRPNEHEHEDDQHPLLTCDLVMKGGITTPRPRPVLWDRSELLKGDARPNRAPDWSP